MFPDDRIRFFIGDVRDKERLSRAMNGVDIVVHAAALKQVPACEYNPIEAVKTNINGSINIINSAIDNNVDRVIALSMQSCSPVNCMDLQNGCRDIVGRGKSYKGGTVIQNFLSTIWKVVGSRGRKVVPVFRTKENMVDHNH